MDWGHGVQVPHPPAGGGGGGAACLSGGDGGGTKSICPIFQWWYIYDTSQYQISHISHAPTNTQIGPRGRGPQAGGGRALRGLTQAAGGGGSGHGGGGLGGGEGGWGAAFAGLYVYVFIYVRMCVETVHLDSHAPLARSHIPPHTPHKFIHTHIHERQELYAQAQAHIQEKEQAHTQVLSALEAQMASYRAAHAVSNEEHHAEVEGLKRAVEVILKKSSVHTYICVGGCTWKTPKHTHY